MAIAFDNAASGSASIAASSLTYSLTVGAGSNRILFVSAIVNINADTISSITYAGVAMTPTANTPLVANQSLYLYYLVNPASGANNVVVTLSIGVSSIFSCASSYTGASQTGVPDSVGSAHATVTSGTVSTTVVAANSWMVGALRNDSNGNGTASTGTTQRTFVTGQTTLDDSGGALTSGSQSLNETWGGASTNFYALVASFAPSVLAKSSFLAFM